MLTKSPRMLAWVIVSLVLCVLAFVVQATHPTSLVAVTLYKAHLMSLGGWGGYWLDRGLFPYDRPHNYVVPEVVSTVPIVEDSEALELISGLDYPLAMLRRALIVGACLVCIGLGA